MQYATFDFGIGICCATDLVLIFETTKSKQRLNTIKVNDKKFYSFQWSPEENFPIGTTASDQNQIPIKPNNRFSRTFKMFCFTILFVLVLIPLTVGTAENGSAVSN